MFRLLWKLIAKTVEIFAESHASRMSAAMTYFTMLSLAPLLMIAIAIAGWVYDDQLAEQEIISRRRKSPGRSAESFITPPVHEPA